MKAKEKIEIKVEPVQSDKYPYLKYSVSFFGRLYGYSNCYQSDAGVNDAIEYCKKTIKRQGGIYYVADCRMKQLNLFEN